MITLTLPWPPSVNAYWRSVGGRVIVSSVGRRYQRQVREAVASSGLLDARFPLRCRLRTRWTMFQPSNVPRCDLSNFLKAAEDALTKAGVWQDDSLIDSGTFDRGEPVEGGALSVQIEVMGKGERHG